MPAAAVIPAPIAYIKVVAVKKLVVEFLARVCRIRESVTRQPGHPSQDGVLLNWCASTEILYCEKIRVFKAGFTLEYISME